ncbi:nucleoporin protein Ndc1-Nup [Lasiosphaeria miniovina]|uniref:Nucleoporin protein Ndc1-Nup n=1 Tax=Lasiosphaeria miniovina TaxID=1954250 RepID=A0AA39ZZD3_9PEZI|nr:nucleoporin protein Ndc1-Nup [Lasiosphaeria miniovina]KAK0706365.1 nucleoporin protein Ndc1-Nup [Lasiosphaeria miniovina]
MATTTTTVRRSPYKDFLQPALHRRFSTTASILLAISYFEAIALASWNSYFWYWFPIGPTGLRALFLSACALSVIILRIAQYHVGLRTSNSAFQTFRQNVFKLPTIESIFTYVTSALLFSQIYLWSIPESAHLEWITHFSADRARLNEKTIFFTAHFVILGLYQAGLHLFNDNDRLSLGTSRAKDAKKTEPTVTQWKQFWDQLPVILIVTVNQSLVGLFISAVVYMLFIRSTVWHALMFFLRPVYNLPKTNLLPTSLPFSFRSILRCWGASLMLLLVWTVGNTAFSIFLVRKPIKNGKPLTAESKDPNGSLLNGLKSKKLAIRCFAVWELADIARSFPDRRKAIYEDIDRKDAPMWAQVYGVCIDTLKEIEVRIDFYGKDPKPPVPDPTVVEQPKRTTLPPKEDAIFQSTPQSKNKFRNEIEKAVTQTVVDPGQGSQLSPLAKKALQSAKDQYRKVQLETTGIDDPGSLFKILSLKVLNSAVGWPFRQEYSRRLAHAVLGEPYGDPSLYINVTAALSQFAVHSLTEDKYGNVQRDVATIIRTLTTVANKLHKFTQTLPTHWTDVVGKRECPEVEAISDALKESLRELVEAFGPYARDLRLSLTDMRLAKEAARLAAPEQAVMPEMRQAR